MGDLEKEDGGGHNSREYRMALMALNQAGIWHRAALHHQPTFAVLSVPVRPQK